MKNLLTRRRPALREIDAEQPPGAPAQGPPIASAREQVGATLTTRAIWIALVVCLVAGPLGLALGMAAMTSAPEPAVAAAPVAERANARVAAGAMGEHLVATWLAATRENPGPLAEMVPALSTTSLPVAATPASELTVASVVEQDSVFSVTVAATITGASGEAVRAYYAVPIAVSDGPPMALAALGLPAAVTAPTRADTPRLAYTQVVEPSSELSATVAQFLTAYATGTGDVDRYTTPGADIGAITAAPYAELTLTQVRAAPPAPEASATPGDGDVVHVLAQASAAITAEQFSPVSYALSLEARAGRWEVASIDPAPLLTKGGSRLSPADPTPSSTPPGDTP